MLKKIIPVLSGVSKSLIPYFIILSYLSVPETKAGDRLLLDKVVATVNEEFILHSELEEVCNQLALEGKVVDTSLKMHLLHELVLHKIWLAKAKLHDVKIPKANIQRACDARIASLIARFGSETKLVEAAHQSIHQIKKSLRQMFKAEYLSTWVREHLTQDVVVTPAAVKAYFNELTPQNRPYYPASVEVSQLVVYPKVSSKREEVVKTKLLNIKQLILDRLMTFSEAAKKYSHDTYSAAKGGEIGWVGLSILPPAYESAALSLKVGEISDPIASEFGWYLIELIARKQDQYNTRHILQVLERTEEEIRLTQVELNKIREKIVTGILTFEEAVKQYSEDKETVSREGLIVHNQTGELLPSQLISVESLDPAIFFAIDTLQVGGVSQPQYMGEGPRSSWRLFYLKKKVSAHPMNLTQDYEKIHHYLLKKKKQETIHKWIQKAKSELVITFSPEYQEVEQLLTLS